MTKKDQIPNGLTEEMERLGWEALQQADPRFATAYLAQFRALPADPQKAEQLHRQLADRENVLQEQGNIPSYSRLLHQACTNLGIDPKSFPHT